ncbi:MAG: TetR/AcrR family transcriptional regulator [Bacteroidia bacterium]|nr:TetR/AcrR family transcriptional regulator [Bacteroidia bacterium]
MQTALEQFLKFGIRDMSIMKLIEPLGISTKTVYKYYKNKEELLEEVLYLHYNQRFKLVENLSEDENIVLRLFDIWYLAVEMAYDVNDLFHKDLHYYYPELENKIELAIGSKFAMQMENFIRKGISAGVFKEDLLPEVAMEGIYILYNAIARTDQFKKFSGSPFEILLNTIALYIRGLCTLKGIQELERYIATKKSFGEENASGKTTVPIMG